MSERERKARTEEHQAERNRQETAEFQGRSSCADGRRELSSGVVKNARTEVPELNGLRALAALAVMLCHAKIVFDHARWATVVARWARSGWLGVDLFFVLSGYLLTRGLYEWREGPHYYRRV